LLLPPSPGSSSWRWRSSPANVLNELEVALAFEEALPDRASEALSLGCGETIDKCLEQLAAIHTAHAERVTEDGRPDCRSTRHRRIERHTNPTMIHRMNDSAWKRARIRATKKWLEKHLRAPHEGFTRIRVHDLKHTFGRRLRAAGVTEEDRKALLGQKNGSITSHYSAAELDQLIEAANKVSVTDSRAPALTILKRRQA
jgi:hypothetical protein